MANAVPDSIVTLTSEEEQLRELQILLRRRDRPSLLVKDAVPAVELPDAVSALLLQILDEMRRGNAVSVVPIHQDLTTQQAAEMIGVSRPFFVKLLEMGKLPFHLAGTHRRVHLRDLLAFRQQRDRERHAALDRIGDAMEDVGVYDKVLLPDA